METENKALIYNNENFNKYFNSILKLSGYETNRESISKELDISLNALNLKIINNTKFNIRQAFKIANMLKMNINDLFASTKEQQVQVILDKDLNGLELKMNPYEFNYVKDYVYDLMTEQNIGIKTVAHVLGLKKGGAYHKINGKTDFTIKQAYDISRLFNVSIEDIFCNNNYIKKHEKILLKKNTKKLIDNYLIKQNVNIEKLSELLGVEENKTHKIYNILSGKSSITIEQYKTLIDLLPDSINIIDDRRSNREMNLMYINKTKIRKYMRQENKTIRTMSEKLPFTKSTLNNLINGLASISDEQLNIICKDLKVNKEDIINESRY